MKEVPGERCLACMKPLTAGTNRCPHCGSSVPCEPNPTDSLQPGYVLANRFVIGKVIGRGGYGISYIAFDNRLQITRCIKEYFPQKYSRRPDMSPEVPTEKEQEFQMLSERFLKEARIMSSMSEKKVSNIVNVFDQLDRNGTTYILMEYLEGCTLDEWITKNKKGLSWKETVKVMQSVLQTLEEIHHHGYLHRDISLSNIFRVQDGSVRVIDFGSAEPIDAARNAGSQIAEAVAPQEEAPVETEEAAAEAQASSNDPKKQWLVGLTLIAVIAIPYFDLSFASSVYVTT